MRKLIKIEHLKFYNKVIRIDDNITWYITKGANIINCDLFHGAKIKIIRHNKNTLILIEGVRIHENNNDYSILVEERYLSTIKRQKFKRKRKKVK